ELLSHEALAAIFQTDNIDILQDIITIAVFQCLAFNVLQQINADAAVLHLDNKTSSVFAEQCFYHFRKHETRDIYVLHVQLTCDFFPHEKYQTFLKSDALAYFVRPFIQWNDLSVVIDYFFNKLPNAIAADFYQYISWLMVKKLVSQTVDDSNMLCLFDQN